MSLRVIWQYMDRSVTQLFTLHIIYIGFFIPVVYALLNDKSSDTYYQMFATLRRKMATFNLILNPLTLVSNQPYYKKCSFRNPTSSYETKDKRTPTKDQCLTRQTRSIENYLAAMRRHVGVKC